MMQVELAAAIERDLDQIADWIAQQSPSRAIRVIETIEQEFHRIAEGPLLYRLRPDIGATARLSVVGRYVILFRVLTPTLVRIERIVFGGRDLSSIFQ